jgi:hypothetical protein
MPNFGLSAFFYLYLDTTRQHGKANRVGGIPEAYVSRGNGREWLEGITVPDFT